MIGQVGLSLLLVIGSALFLRTLWGLQNIPLGFAKEHLLQAGVDGETAGYKDQDLAAFYRDVAERLRTLPGVRGVSYSENGVMTGGESNVNVEAEGFTAQNDDDRQSRFDRIAPGYFDVVGIPLILGRDVGAQDTATSTRVCVINDELAHRFFAARSPIGRHLTARFGDTSASLEIVGVVKNARTRALRGKIWQRFYLPVDQGEPGRKFSGSFIYEIRTAGEANSVVDAVRKAIAGVNPDAPVSFTRTMEEVIAGRTVFTRMIARLCSIFGGLALLLAATGLYGVLSYGVTRRTNEIGIRMALGANRGSVIGMILRETGILVTLGLALGFAAALLSMGLVASQLYGLSKFDPASFLASAALLSVVGLVAGYIPAARAARVDPVRALRHE